jgi:hypothetical protein
MPNFNEKQLKELEASEIASDIAELNVWAMVGEPALQAMFYALGNEDRKNTGQVQAKLLRSYDHIYKDGGLAFFGIDPVTGERTECISFKPNRPLSPDRKYENPPKAKPIALYPAVTYRVWQMVGERFKIELPTETAFINPNDFHVSLLQGSGTGSARSVTATGKPNITISSPHSKSSKIRKF